MRFRVGYQLTITGLFVAVVLAVGLALVFLSFDRARSITRSAALTYIDRVAEHTADRVDGEFDGVKNALDVLKQLPPVTAGAIAENRALYSILAAMLRQQQQLYNLYVGYEDGAFIELDALDRGGAGFREKLAAPEAAAFRLIVIERAPGAEARTRTMSYLTADLKTLAESSRDADYDPRERPWYRGGFEPSASPITDPYRFTVGLAGYTVRAPFTEGRRGIVAGDILLANTDALLKQQKLGASGVVFLFDYTGRVIAHPRMSEFLRARPLSETIELPQLNQLESIDLTVPLAMWRFDGIAKQIFEADDGRTYVAAFRSIDAAGAANLRLAVLAPLDEFFAEVEAGRRTLLLLALAFVIAALPIVWWIGSILSRSMKSLATETDRIQRFDVERETAPLHSVIREMDDLGRSVSTMREVVRTFSRFVPKRLVQQLVESGRGLSLGGSRREVTVLFTDVENFTSISENADPEQIMIQTSRYFAALTEVIMAHRGTVDKFVGDAVMAFWNAPADDPDHVINACHAVLACREANERLNAVFAREEWPAYKTRFGLHAGEAVVGMVGSTDRMAYTVLGATVNLAARMEPLNKEYGTAILVSETIQRRAASRFEFREVATVAPKGFKAAVRVYELCGALKQPATTGLAVDTRPE